MRYRALAADYDGTLATHGRIDDGTWEALKKLRDSGRKVIMVTGRELDELLGILDHPEAFDRIVAENGALIYTPATKEVRLLAQPPTPTFIEELKKRGVDRVSAGRVIVATWEPHQDTALHVIRDLGLELQVIFNKGAVMILPSGVNKATGLAAALAELGLSSHNIASVGDAENDHALLELAECGCAVANALPSLKDRADLVLARDHGPGVTELIEHMIENDLKDVQLLRHRIPFAKHGDEEISFDPYASTMLVCGTSGSGKSTLTTSIIEKLCSAGYQFAIIDPEGDYSEIDMAVVLGSPTRAPLVEEVLDVLKDPARNVAVNLLGVALEHRPEFCAQLLAALSDLRSRTGRPHWLILDEAHHLLPAQWRPAAEMPARAHGTLYVTVHPESLAPAVIPTIDTVLVIGEHPEQRIADLCEVAGRRCPSVEPIEKLPTGQAMYWRSGEPTAMVIETEKPKGERKRHSRKYIEGNIGSERAFYFKGPDGKLKLKAHNLLLFMQLGDGVDDDTWQFHLDKGDYTTWLRTEIKDPALADEVTAIAEQHLSPVESRAAVREAIEKRYTLPADKPSGLVDKPAAAS
ncbi:MAG: HAD-IIB family hydrolase [Deltaproteobacteria bacterium]|nr:HAD-IIB family hydrolase [Deltaproteobacteria bacterium]